MADENGLCESIGEFKNVQAVFLVNDGSIVQWKAKSGVKMPSPEYMDNILVRKHMILALAGTHDDFLGRFHYNLSRYDESDVLLLDAPAGKRSMLMVMIKKPYDLDGILHGIRGALKGT